MIKILFLCSGNSCRSQMAEGWTRQLKSDLIEPFSAGINPTNLDPIAVKVMSEVGIDISSYTSKGLDDLKNIDFDLVVTVCDKANESCPLFPGKTKVIHAGFEDPPRLALSCGSEDEILTQYRKVRDQIRIFVSSLSHFDQTIN